MNKNKIEAKKAAIVFDILMLPTEDVLEFVLSVILSVDANMKPKGDSKPFLSTVIEGLTLVEGEINKKDEAENATKH